MGINRIRKKGCKMITKEANLERYSFINLFFKFLHKKNSISCMETTEKIKIYTRGLSKKGVLYLV
jgi:hypothetical protein